MQLSIAIIGAGFSGISTAAQLLAAPVGHPLSILLIDSKERFGRGLAYGRNDANWLMNAPADALSARPDTPNDFIDYCRSRGVAVAKGAYAPRELYGSYLYDFYLKLASSPGRHTVRAVHDKVSDIRLTETSKIVVVLESQKKLLVDYAILATGASSRSSNLKFDPRVLGARYVPNPLEALQTRRFASGSRALILGSGLTAMDVAWALHQKFRMHSVLLSRRGLLPSPHEPFEPRLDDAAVQSLRARLLVRPLPCLAALRESVTHHQAMGGNWREVVDAVRPCIPGIWSGWSTRDKSAFMRHLAPYWEVHRHRSTPLLSETISMLRKSAKISIEVGHIQRIFEAGGALNFAIRRRHTCNSVLLQADLLFNCTVPSTAYADALHKKLARRGVITSDEQGLCIDPAYRVISRGGASHAALLYIGPQLKSRLWEATAIPELRWHAMQLASGLTDTINRKMLQ